MEAHIWRALHGSLHPLPAKASARLFARLGDPAGARLLADKVGTAALLSEQGIRFPELVDLCPRGDVRGLAARLASMDGTFVKPRHGWGGRANFDIRRDGSGWQVNGRPSSTQDLLGRLQRELISDDLLVQKRIVATPELRDLVVGDRPPVLRLVTARMPEGEPFLHSALLSMGVPDRDHRNFLTGAIHAPVDPKSGRLSRGLSLHAPQDRIAELSWNGALLLGRRIQGFEQAVEAALRGMAAVAPRPLIHWDIILTASGPVMLEGNTSGNWILATLPEIDALTACALPPLLARWMPGTFVASP